MESDNKMLKYKHILLVYPEVPNNTYWSFTYALKFIRKKNSMPPLGLITVAALIPPSYEVKLVDMNIQPLQDDHIQWADMVFISAMMIQQEAMEAVIARCRRMNKKVVLGGPIANSSHADIRGVDHFVPGEVENTLAAFLEDLENGSARPLYPLPPHPDITHAPPPRFDLLDLHAYASMSVQYSRGCPFHCEFCDIWPLYGNSPRLKSTPALLAELADLYRLGWRGAVFVVDDNFIGNKKQVKANLLPALKNWQQSHGYPFRFFTEASINMADDEELLAAMRESGFNEVFIGIETPDTDGLRESGKVQNLKRDLDFSIRRIQRHGIEVMAGFIVGFDNDKEDIFTRQISFIENNGIPKAMIGLLNALPGTRLYHRLEKENRIVAASAGNNTHHLSTNFITRMDSRILLDGYKKILAHIYDFRLKNYFKRCNRLLDRIEYRNFFPRRIRFPEISAFLKSLFRQPFTPYGLQYLKFLSRNLIKHRDVFAEVITLSIMGHHFHTITHQTLKTEKISAALDEKYRSFNQLLARYSQTIMQNSMDNLAAVAKLWAKQGRMLKQMRNKIEKIHVDFREDLIRKYIDISSQMREAMIRFEQKALAG